jgi:hypothetical protein
MSAVFDVHLEIVDLLVRRCLRIGQAFVPFCEMLIQLQEVPCPCMFGKRASMTSIALSNIFMESMTTLKTRAPTYPMQNTQHRMGALLLSQVCAGWHYCGKSLQDGILSGALGSFRAQLEWH